MLLGLVLGGALLTHAGFQISKALPADVRTGAVDAVKRRPRLAVVTLAVFAWTLVYALYSLAYPSGAALIGASSARSDVELSVDTAEEPALADNRELLPPSIGGELALPSESVATVTPEPTPTPTTTPPSSGDASPPTTTAPAPPPPEPEPCPFEAVADAFGPDAAAVLCPQGSAP